MQRRRYNVRIILLTAGLWLATSGPVQAQTLVIDDELTFGRIVMRDNSAPRDIQLLPTGNYIADPTYIFFDEEPALGQVTVTGQTPNALMDVTIDMVGIVVGPSGGGGGTGTFTLHDPFTVPAVVVTNGAGNVTFQIGATLRSDGSGTPFLDNDYLGIFSVSVVPD